LIHVILFSPIFYYFSQIASIALINYNVTQYIKMNLYYVTQKTLYET